MINFFSTHLSFTNVDARINQVEEIVPYVEETEQNNPGVATILVGDFNDEPNSEPIIMLTGTSSGEYYIDTFFKIHPYGNPGYTQETGNLERRIDYIFYKNNGSLLIQDSYAVMDEPYSGNLYCSDHLGVMTNIIADPTGILESENILDGYNLYQNYPNPFNPSTTIEYSIPVGSRQYTVGSLFAGQAGKKHQSFNQPVRRSSTKSNVNGSINQSNSNLVSVQLNVYDILGKEVATLVNEHQRPGSYQINFDASGLTSGVYFYTLTSGQFRSIKKLIVIK